MKTLKLPGYSRFKDWFPKRLYRHNAPRPGKEVYKVYGASTNRFLFSPLNMMRRKLNEFERLKLLAPNVPVF